MSRHGNRTTRFLAVLLLFAAVTAGLLYGPVAGWLHGREMWLAAGEAPDAVYLVCGATAQGRRVGALVEYLAGLPPERLTGLEILIGSDPLESMWSREDQRNLTMSEWAVKRLRARLRNYEAAGGNLDVRLPSSITIVPGRHFGTDAEMSNLAAYLAAHTNIAHLALATSPYHLRRCVLRLRAHTRRPLALAAVVDEPGWRDRAPWTVLLEVGKIGRDAMGLAGAPLISRQFWMRGGRGGPPSKRQGLLLAAGGCLLVVVAALLIRAHRPRGRQ